MINLYPKHLSSYYNNDSNCGDFPQKEDKISYRVDGSYS